jgi:malto-oligosyltrehalose trehalohydrolase
MQYQHLFLRTRMTGSAKVIDIHEFREKLVGDLISQHRMPFGSELQDNATVAFRIFAPDCQTIRLALDGGRHLLTMHAGSNGWHELATTEALAGTRYLFVLPDGTRVPDPASRFQPDDVYGPSEVIDPQAYRWRDAGWYGRPWETAVLYELHVGAFTESGTFLGAIEKLDHLAQLGITAIELMAVADFPGMRNWGYDEILMYAPDSVYGRPDDLKALVDAAHARGIMVIFDVIYNHLGAEGNLLPRYFPRFFSPVHESPWGKVPNFDADGSEQVREFIIHNALYWIEEFHADGLRLDASHDMVDRSSRHILDELVERVHAITEGQTVHLIAEDERNISARLTRDKDGRPQAYSAQWNHQMAHLRELPADKLCAPSTIPNAKIETVARMIAVGYSGKAKAFGEAGEISCRVPPTAYISFLQTHDLVGNDLIGQRIYSKASLEAVRSLSAIYLLAPQIPMLFMGDEWGASTPFPFFCDFRSDIAQDVRKGRLDFLQKNLQIEPSALEHVPDPLALATFRSAHLDWNEMERGEHSDWFAWYRNILRVRREEIAPLLRGISDQSGDYRVVGPAAFIATWMLAAGVRLTLEANLCDQSATGFPDSADRHIWEEGIRIGPGELGAWTVRWGLSSDSEDASISHLQTP